MGIQFGYSFPAIRGIQAGREYFVSMCPMRLLPKIFLFNEEELAPEFRAQRRLNRSRIPRLCDYIVKNKDSYAFSAITASLDGEIEFSSLGDEGDTRNIGILRVPMETRFIINDGQHRRAAIERAIQDSPELGDESISVVFYQDPGLERCQQLFADLNRHTIRPSASLGVLYDHRDEQALLVKKLVGDAGIFQDLVELEKTTLSARSRRLFTLSAIYKATDELPLDPKSNSLDDAVNLALSFWTVVTKNIKEWKLVQQGKITSGEVREDYIHSHAIALQAIARAGATLIEQYPKSWERRLGVLSKIDWRRKNTKLWEGRALVGGRVSKGQQNVVLTTNVLKKEMGLALSPEEQRAEDAIARDKKKRQ